MSEHKSPIILLAKALSPKDAKTWIDDMADELSFVKNNKLSWQIGIFNFALKQRISSINLKSPQGLAFASFALTAILAILIVLPNRQILFPKQVNRNNVVTSTAENSAADETALKM